MRDKENKRTRDSREIYKDRKKVRERERERERERKRWKKKRKTIKMDVTARSLTYY